MKNRITANTNTNVNDVTLITRAFDAEAPYVKSFIEHYLAIGVAEIRFVTLDFNPTNIIREICSKFQETSFHVYSSSNEAPNKQLFEVSNRELEFVKTKFVFHIDVDEFLDTRDINSTLESSHITYRWSLAPFLRQQHTAPAYVDAILWQQGKSLCETNQIAKITDHVMVRKDAQEATDSPVPLIHYWGRGLNDILLKTFVGKFTKEYDVSLIEKSCDGLLPPPPRILFFAYCLSAAKSQPDAKVTNHVYIDTAIEDYLLETSIPQKYRVAFEGITHRLLEKIDVKQIQTKIAKQERDRNKPLNVTDVIKILQSTFSR